MDIEGVLKVLTLTAKVLIGSPCMYNFYCFRLIFGLNIFIHISINSNIQMYILQYNHDGIQKKVVRLIRICFPLKIMVHSLKLYPVKVNKIISCIQAK